jgi:hypothetical protein
VLRDISWLVYRSWRGTGFILLLWAIAGLYGFAFLYEEGTFFQEILSAVAGVGFAALGIVGIYIGVGEINENYWLLKVDRAASIRGLKCRFQESEMDPGYWLRATSDLRKYREKDVAAAEMEW